MNWAFEGTRSRMGKLMPPRYGLLKCAGGVSRHRRHQHIIPISISYDLMRDVEEYATEQTGRGKGAESCAGSSAISAAWLRPMGKIYMDIGEPVVLAGRPTLTTNSALSKIASRSQWKRITSPHYFPRW